MVNKYTTRRLHLTYIKMSRHITLDARISVHFPGAADIVIGLEDDMFDEIL